MTDPIMASDWSLLPVTPAQARAAGSRYYFDGRPCRHGHLAPRRTHNTDCYQCVLDRAKQRNHKTREESRPAREAAAAQRRALSAALAPVRRATSRERAREAHRQRIQRAIEEQGNTDDGYALLAAHDRARREPAKQRERVRRRRERGLVGYRMMRLRTPPWLTQEERMAIAAFYPAPPGCHTDHIVPITHWLLAGLHVPGNLQHLKSRANIKKDNLFDCTITEAESFVARGLAVWAFDVDETGVIDWSKYPRPMTLG